MRISDGSSDVCSSDLKRDVKMPEDLKGMKRRVVGSPLYIDTFTALGANPTQMSWADAQPALATGAVDGQENPLSIYAGAKLYDVAQKHLTLWNYVADPLVFVVNKRSEEHTSEIQSLMRISYAVFCLKKKKYIKITLTHTTI